MNGKESPDVVEDFQDVEEGFVPPHRGPVGPSEPVHEGTEELHMGPQSRKRFLHSYELGGGGRGTLSAILIPLSGDLNLLSEKLAGFIVMDLTKREVEITIRAFNPKCETPSSWSTFPQTSS